MTGKDKQMLREHIDRLVENFIEEEFLSEKDTDKKDDKKKDKKNNSKKKSSSNKKDSKKKDSNKKREERINSKNTKAASRRARVISWLKNDSVNCAEIMRRLWKPSKKKEDAARSYFYKCRDGALNDSGVAYSFSDSEINRLYAIQNDIL